MAHSSWGSGWPNCQPDKINRGFFVDTRWGRVTFPGGVRAELSELISRLVKETANRGYRFGVEGNPSYGCWGYNCRAIAGSITPSNHSWGLSIDINAPKNPMGYKLITDMPGWMPDLWNAYGFRWGGDYSSKKDAMHYEFMGSMSDAARQTQIARNNRLGENRVTVPTPTPPEPEPRKVDKVYALMKGDASTEWWLTDMQTKRHMKTSKEAEAFIWMIVANGGVVDRGPNNTPKTWPQAYVDNIARADSSNLVDATLKRYVGAGNGPLHSIIRQVLKDEVQEMPDAG